MLSQHIISKAIYGQISWALENVFLINVQIICIINGLNKIPKIFIAFDDETLD